MPALLAQGLLSLVASAGLAFSFDADLRAEARAQQLRPPVGENVTTQWLEVEPGAGVEGWSPTLQLDLAYAPRFTHQGGDGPDSDTWLQRAWAGVRWRPSAEWEIVARGTATAGTVDLFRVATAPGQPGEPPPVGQAAPVASILDYRRLELLLSADWRLAPRFELRVELALLREGGADDAEREILPLQQSAMLRGELDWRLSARATLAGLLSTAETHYFDVAVGAPAPGDAPVQSWSNRMGRAEAIWRYALTSHTRVWAGAGLVLVDSGAPSSATAGVQPFGEVGLEGESGMGWPRLSGGVAAAATPIEDRLVGTVAERVELRGWGLWTPSARWFLGASAMAARVMNGPTEREAFTAGEFWLTRAVREVLLVTAGGRWTTQWPAPTPGRSGLPESQWVVYLAAQLTTREAVRPPSVGRPAAAGRASF